jgi:hypothetical protein
VELSMLCGSYRLRFGEWPRQAHLHPHLLQGLAQILDWRDFERLAERLELSTLADDHPNRPGFVSGDAGRVGYDELMPRISSREELEKWLELSEEARAWLAVEPHPPRGD